MRLEGGPVAVLLVGVSHVLPATAARDIRHLLLLHRPVAVVLELCPERADSVMAAVIASSAAATVAAGSLGRGEEDAAGGGEGGGRGHTVGKRPIVAAANASTNLTTEHLGRSGPSQGREQEEGWGWGCGRGRGRDPERGRGRPSLSPPGGGPTIIPRSVSIAGLPSYPPLPGASPSELLAALRTKPGKLTSVEDLSRDCATLSATGLFGDVTVGIDDDDDGGDSDGDGVNGGDDDGNGGRGRGGVDVEVGACIDGSSDSTDGFGGDGGEGGGGGGGGGGVSKQRVLYCVSGGGGNGGDGPARRARPLRLREIIEGASITFRVSPNPAADVSADVRFVWGEEALGALGGVKVRGEVEAKVIRGALRLLQGHRDWDHDQDHDQDQDGDREWVRDGSDASGEVDVVNDKGIGGDDDNEEEAAEEEAEVGEKDDEEEEEDWEGVALHAALLDSARRVCTDADVGGVAITVTSASTSRRSEHDSNEGVDERDSNYREEGEGSIAWVSVSVGSDRTFSTLEPPLPPSDGSVAPDDESMT